MRTTAKISTTATILTAMATTNPVGAVTIEVAANRECSANMEGLILSRSMKIVIVVVEIVVRYD